MARAPKTVDPDFEGLKRLDETLNIAIKEIDDFRVRDAIETIYYAKGLISGIDSYFNLRIKE